MNMSKEPKKIVLSINLIYFIGLTFLATVNQEIKFITATVIPDRKKQTILKGLNQVMKIFKEKGHIIEAVDFNAQMNPIHTNLSS
jgi:hypothetical protein